MDSLKKIFLLKPKDKFYCLKSERDKDVVIIVNKILIGWFYKWAKESSRKRGLTNGYYEEVVSYIDDILLHVLCFLDICL